MAAPKVDNTPAPKVVLSMPSDTTSENKAEPSSNMSYANDAKQIQMTSNQSTNDNKETATKIKFEETTLDTSKKVESQV